MGPCLCKGNIEPIPDKKSAPNVVEFLSKVRPLDLIVFRGSDQVSSLISKLEKDKTGRGSVTHVEVAMTRDWCSEIKPLHKDLDTAAIDSDKLLFSWGSTLSGALNDGSYNAETNKTTFGVQLRVLEDLITCYLNDPEGNVGVCRLINSPTEHRPNETDIEYYERKLQTRYRLNKVYKEYNGNTYNANPLALLGSMFPELRSLRDASNEVLEKFQGQNKWLFCSELAAVIYQHAGVITDETDGIIDGKVLNAADVLPIDFLGCDADSDGLKNAICEYPPIWIKKLL